MNGIFDNGNALLPILLLLCLCGNGLSGCGTETNSGCCCNSGGSFGGGFGGILPLLLLCGSFGGCGCNKPCC